jgi:hypothetical protein
MAIVALMASSGCRAPKASDLKPSKLFSMNSSWPWGDGDEPQKGTPVRVVGTWTDTVLTQPGQKPQRGFGGRLVFYGRDEKKPILVDGQLVVYAFDETGRDATDTRPTRRYVFPADQVLLHMSTSEIGATYSFWLPWDEAGGPRTEVSLICRFEPNGGAVITSEQTRHLLPGALTPHSATVAGQPPRLPEGIPSRPARPTLESLRNQQRSSGGPQLANYESAAGLDAGVNQAKVETMSMVPERRMSVTSIALPDSYNLRAAALNANSRPADSQPSTGAPASQRQTSAPSARQNIQPLVTAPGAQPASRPTNSTMRKLPTTQPQTTAGFGSLQLARPQLATPQWLTVQPATSPAGATTTVNQPAIPASPPAH